MAWKLRMKREIGNKYAVWSGVWLGNCVKNARLKINTQVGEGFGSGTAYGTRNLKLVRRRGGETGFEQWRAEDRRCGGVARAQKDRTICKIYKSCGLCFAIDIFSCVPVLLRRCF